MTRAFTVDGVPLTWTDGAFSSPVPELAEFATSTIDINDPRYGYYPDLGELLAQIMRDRWPHMVIGYTPQQAPDLPDGATW